MMRNYMFIGEMVYSGITDPEIIRKMYYQGFANPVPMGNGLTLWENVQGFVKRNLGPWDDWEENTSIGYMAASISDINAYNMTQFALSTLNLQLYDDLTEVTTRTYNDWVENNLYYEANRNIWSDYHRYFDFPGNCCSI